MKILKFLGRMAQTLLVIFLSLILAANLWLLGSRVLTGSDDALIFGFHWAVVLSGSMEPEISIDDLVIARAADSYAVGDIITYRNGRSLTTHRIVGETEEGFLTKGDANNTGDMNPVEQSQVIGRVVATVPGVGLAVYYLKSPLGMLYMLVLGVLAIEVPYLLDRKKYMEEG